MARQKIRLAARPSTSRATRRSLSTTGDISLFGCNVASGVTGQSFVNQLHQSTGADIAASDDLTGVGGDWTLEVQAGKAITSVLGKELVCMQGDSNAFAARRNGDN